MRLNKFIAQSTRFSRRKAEEYILSGRVAVNGQTVTNLATDVAPSDGVSLDGSLLNPQTHVYYALNKPKGYTTTTKDRFAKKLIISLVPSDPPRLSGRPT